MKEFILKEYTYIVTLLNDVHKEFGAVPLKKFLKYGGGIVFLILVPLFIAISFIQIIKAVDAAAKYRYNNKSVRSLIIIIALFLLCCFWTGLVIFKDSLHVYLLILMLLPIILQFILSHSLDFFPKPKYKTPKNKMYNDPKHKPFTIFVEQPTGLFKNALYSGAGAICYISFFVILTFICSDDISQGETKGVIYFFIMLALFFGILFFFGTLIKGIYKKIYYFFNIRYIHFDKDRILIEYNILFKKAKTILLKDIKAVLINDNELLLEKKAESIFEEVYENKITESLRIDFKNSNKYFEISDNIFTLKQLKKIKKYFKKRNFIAIVQFREIDMF